MTLIEILDGVEVWETVNGVAYVKDGVLLREERSITLTPPPKEICSELVTENDLSIENARLWS